MTGAVFLDLSKAFDLVNHTMLLKKLSTYQCSTNAVEFFTSYLTARTQYVQINGSKSSEKYIEHGVPQGSILGPLLFSIFINDLPLHITNPNVTCSLFADDGTLDTSASTVSTINEDLQESLNQVSEWCKMNYMVPNPDNTKCMLITTRQKHQLQPAPLKLVFNSTDVQQVHEHRLLGITVDDQLCWHNHINSICKKVSKNLYLLSKLRLFTDESTRQLFYQAHIECHINYSSVVWSDATGSNMKRLNSLHRRAIKLIADPKISHLCTDEKFKQLEILHLSQQFIFNKSVLMHTVALKKAPNYLISLFTINQRQSRKKGTNYNLPRPRIDIFRSSFSYSGVQCWNAIPYKISSLKSKESFKIKMKKHLLGAKHT